MLKKMVGPWPALLALGVLFCLAPGCPKDDTAPQKEVTYQHEAGSSYVSVLAVAPWGEVQESLAPKFEMDANKALEEVLPISGNIQDMIFKGLGFKLKAALPTAPTESKETKAVTDGKESSSKTDSKEEKSGDLATAPEGKVLADRKSLGEGATPPSAEGLKTDPMLRYLAATALLQEVQLLNQYLKYAPKAKGFDAYLVRLQISLMPNARNMPYDAYTILSFFPANWQNLKGSRALTGGGSGGSSPTVIPATKENRAQDSRDISSSCTQIGKEAPARQEGFATAQLPMVIPLLVSDSLEAANYARSQEMLLRLALGISAMVQGMELSAELDSSYDRLRGSTNKDLNSLFSVARVSPNTLRVRMGAYRQAANAYTMVPRTHSVSFLLLVPKAYFSEKGQKQEETEITVLSKTILMNATEGKPLRVRSETEALKKVTTLAQEYVPQDKWPLLDQTCNPCQPGFTCAQTLLNQVNSNNFPAFAGIANKKLGVSASRLYSFWLDMVSTRTGGLYAMAPIPVPATQKPSDPTVRKNITAWLLDNGTSTCTEKMMLALPEGKKICPTEVSGNDCVTIKATLEIKTSNPPLYLPCSDSDCPKDPDPPLCNFNFDSLAKKWGFKAKDLAGKLRLLVAWKLGPKTGSDLYPAYYHSTAKQEDQDEAEPGRLELSASSKIIMAKEGQGTLAVQIKVNPPAGGAAGADSKKESLSIVLGGADLQAKQESLGDVAALTDGAIVVKKSGRIVLSLANLNECAPVTLTPMAGKKPLKSVLTLPVRAVK